MTGGPSMRQVAAAIGASHQQVGRWLKEKPDGTPRKIPAHFLDNLNSVFDYHKSIVKQQAKQDGLPYNPQTPVFIKRGLLSKVDSNGNRIKGDRVIAEHTKFLDPQIREQFFRNMYRTGQFDYATVRSLVDALKYAENKAAMELDESPNRRISRATLTAKILNSFYSSEMAKAIKLGNFEQHFYTQKEYFGQAANNEHDSINSLLSKLRQKHEPAAIDLADEFVFQTYPLNYVKPKPKTSNTQKNTRANLRRK